MQTVNGHETTTITAELLVPGDTLHRDHRLDFAEVVRVQHGPGTTVTVTVDGEEGLETVPYRQHDVVRIVATDVNVCGNCDGPTEEPGRHCRYCREG